MSNFNVMLETKNLEVGQNIARKIRERTGGKVSILGVVALWGDFFFTFDYFLTLFLKDQIV